jgi:hypothetical protein
MARHDVELTWDESTHAITSDPNPLSVMAGDSITFKVIDPPRGRAIIVFREPEHFSTDLYREGDAPVVVNSAASTKYFCHVTLDGEPLDVGRDTPGNSIEPGTGDSAAAAAKRAKVAGAAFSVAEPAKGT